MRRDEPIGESMRKKLDIAMAIALIRNLHSKGLICDDILVTANKKVKKLLETTEKV